MWELRSSNVIIVKCEPPIFILPQNNDEIQAYLSLKIVFRWCKKKWLISHNWWKFIHLTDNKCALLRKPALCESKWTPERKSLRFLNALICCKNDHRNLYISRKFHHLHFSTMTPIVKMNVQTYERYDWECVVLKVWDRCCAISSIMWPNLPQTRWGALIIP